MINMMKILMMNIIIEKFNAYISCSKIVTQNDDNDVHDNHDNIDNDNVVDDG